ncbi:MAG: hypothetical protein KA714_30740 [Limnoraphis sp. WC205]|nr:hypothetical protein [Limnoraphis sp. WC205]
MKIVQQTPTLLKLKLNRYYLHFLRQLLFFIPLFFIPFSLTGILILSTSFRQAILECTRSQPTQNNCKLTSISLFEKQITSTDLEQLQSAEVEVSVVDNMDMYRVILLTKNGKIPLTNVASSGTDIPGYANQINAFLADPEQMSLEITSPATTELLLPLVFGGVFLLIGGGGIVFYLIKFNQTSCTFDKVSGKMHLQQRNFFISKQENVMLDEIKNVKIDEEITSDDKTLYLIKLLLKSGSFITLRAQGSQAEHYKIAETISQFLDIKFLKT